MYHYTSPEGLLGIIANNEVWMSDYSFLNDAEELTYGLAVAKQRFEAAAAEIPDAADVLTRLGNPRDLSDIRVCVGSFSMVGDSLSQWRAYGSLAIGFQVGGLMFGYNNSVRLDRVIYDREVQNKLIDLYAHLAASAYAKDKEGSHASKAESLYARGGEELLEMTAFFKHPTFADEHEARLVHIEDRKVYENLRIERPPHRFRTAGGLLVPYVTTKDLVTLPGKYPDRLPIAEIIIGPTRHADVLQRGIERLLASYNYDSVKILRSTAPLRS